MTSYQDLSTNHLVPKILIKDYSEANHTQRIEDIGAAIYPGIKLGDEEAVASDSEGGSSQGDDDASCESQNSSAPPDELYGHDPDGLQRDDYTDLGKLLRMCAIRHMDRRIQCFWPNELLDRALTRGRVVEELQEYQKADPRLFEGKALGALADNILLYHRKVFAILTLLAQGSCIENVIEAGLKDKHLPLYAREATEYKLYRKSRRDSKSHLVKCLLGQGWQTHQRERFLEIQYALNPQVMELNTDGRTPKHKDFELQDVLPFMHQKRRHQGGYGSVTEVRIHPDCHRFDNVLKSIRTENSFALKQLINNNPTEFEKEVAALKRFNGFAHDHMITLLMTWTLNNQYYLLFPLANCDLEEYWEKEERPVLDIDMTRWMSKQIVGIASALANMHEPPSNMLTPDRDAEFARHGDLKPENILLFDSPTDERGVLLIADLGLATLNSILSRTQTNTRTQYTPRYRSPECDIKGGKVRRSYDIWTFGCILLEWVCWAIEGRTARNEFTESLFSPYPTGSTADMFFDMIDKKGEVHQVILKKQVFDKMDNLHKSDQCMEYFHDLLYLIEDEMLVVRHSDRISSGNLHQRLYEMNTKLVRDASYCRKSSKLPRPAKVQSPLEAVFKDRPLPRRLPAR